ncbi:hypothetical protein WJX84_003019 [Apatococcus fuscideae]|uniref:Uncharacterized protein n=1 Tax=Apatococcus fuscideae TaxID=2026836 RepID=A0AAW1TFW0_9CHLO
MPLQQILAQLRYDGVQTCPSSGLEVIQLFLEEIDDAAWPFASRYPGANLSLKLWDPEAGSIKVCEAFANPQYTGHSLGNSEGATRSL